VRNSDIQAYSRVKRRINSGFGLDSYRLAVEAIIGKLGKEKDK